MYDPNYQLTPNVEKPRKGTKRGWQAGVLAVGLTLTLIFGAMYAPMLWESTSVSASPVAQLNPVPVTTASLVDDQVALADLYDAVSPSVVSIQTSVKASSILNQGIPNFNIPGAPNQQPQLPEGFDPNTLIPQGQGTGWLFDNEGHIVTNNHVVEGAEGVTVIFYDGTWADAEVVATDPQSDLAVLKVDAPEGFPWRPLVLANENDLRVGHSVIAIGNPYGYANTMTTGIISALGRSFPTSELGESRYTLPDVIQTDAAINPGNSGGPLLNLNGEVVGVNFAIESATRTNSGVGFAIPGSIVNRVVPSLIAEGAFDYPYLGISGTSISPALAKEIGLSNAQTGAYVASVVEGSPAAEAGVIGADPETSVGGDIIVAFNGERIASFDALVAELVTGTQPGDTATLSILRNGEPMDLEITIGARPTASSASSQPESDEEPTPGQGTGISASRAMQIAERETEGMLSSAVTNRSVESANLDGVPAWIVTLETDSETATVTVDRATGDVLEVTVQ